MVIVMEQNLLRDAERVVAASAFIPGGISGFVNVMYPSFSFIISDNYQMLTEYHFADGGYNAKQFDKGFSREKPEKFGTIESRYQKELKQLTASVFIPIKDAVKCSAGYKASDFSYNNRQTGILPLEEKDSNAFTLSLFTEYKNTTKESGGLERMFGLGMAEVKDWIASRLSSPAMVSDYQIAFEKGDPILGSESAFDKFSCMISQQTTFSHKNTLQTSLRYGEGSWLPLSQLFATNQKDGMKGFYAREFRGDSIINANIIYAHPLFISLRGFMSVEVFTDYAVCWMYGVRYEKQGAGGVISYRFWRFPLPLGMGYSYSFDDKNWQFTFSLGGRF
jgi:hypothetical protein